MFSTACLIKKARRQGFVLDEDCEDVPMKSIDSAKLLKNGEPLWRAQCKKPKPRFGKVIWANTKGPFIVGSVCMILRGTSNAFSMPLLLKQIIDALIDGDMDRFNVYVLCLLAERIASNIVDVIGGYLMAFRVPEEFTATVMAFVAQKALQPGLRGLSQAGVNPTALVGRELNTICTYLGLALRLGFMAVPSLFSGSVTLLMLLGWPALLGITWVLITVVIGIYMQVRAKASDEKMARVATKRLAILTNAITAIKAIKFFTWESDFLDELTETRREECMWLSRKVRQSTSGITLGRMTPITASLITFISYALIGNTIRASDIFACNAVFMTMRFAVGAIGILIVVKKMSDLVIGRCAKLLLLQEQPPRQLLPAGEQALACISDLHVDFAQPPTEDKTASKEKQVEDTMPSKDTFRLESSGSLPLVESGQLTAICGSVGSGKSTLLLALLGGVDGDANVTGTARAVESVGWCPQKAFTISTSVKDNILLGREYDEEKMVSCLADSCFGSDVDSLSMGLEEVIGERGTTLSGGQQARLSLARALYDDPLLLVLDDPLAAVDAAVGRAMLRAFRMRVKAERPQGQAQPGAIIVLNQLNLLPNFDKIIFLKDGVVEAHGTFAELMQRASFAKFMEDIDSHAISLDIEEDVEVAKTETRKSRSSVTRKTNRTSVGSIIQKEIAGRGLVRSEVLFSYLLAPGKPFLAITVVTAVYTFSTLGLRDWWLSVWADAGGGEDAEHIGVFALFSCLHILGASILVVLIAGFAERAGRNLHSDCANCLMRAKMSYFDETPSGRITSRFGADLGQVDNLMATQIDQSIIFGLTLLVLVVGVCVNAPLMAIVFALGFIVSIPVTKGLAVLTQDSKRHANNAMAPVLTNLAEMQRGAALVKVLGCQDFFMLRHHECADYWTIRCALAIWSLPMAAYWVHFLHVMVLAATAGIAIWKAEDLRDSPGMAAMFFSYAALFGLFGDASMSTILSVLTNATSLERLLDYKLGGLPQEPPWHLKADPAPDAWPKKGAVHFDKVTFRYREELPVALNNFNLSIAGGEKLGVVGRTGAGKSTLTTALFRLLDCEDGAIYIDGVDIASLGLHTLRRAISMIPQEPIVMSGTVRYNLDPFGKFDKDQLQNALECSGLGSAVDLDSTASGTGASLSSGQLQLLTFARTALQPKTVIVMDEPTASVDMQTDKLIQQAVHATFSRSTVIIIAHRLDTVMGYCDRIAVMESGRLAEIGTPDELVKNADGHLAHLVKAGQRGTENGKTIDDSESELAAEADAEVMQDPIDKTDCTTVDI